MIKKLILFILLSLCLAFQASALTPMIMTSGTSVVADYSDILVWDRAEGLNQSATLDFPGTITWTNSNEGSFAAGGRVNNGYVLTDATSNGNDKAYEDLTSSLASGTSGTLYCEMYVSTWTDEAQICRVYQNGSNVFSLQLGATANGDVEILWVEGGSADIITASSCALSSSTWYLVEMQYNAATNYRKLAVYDTSGSEKCTTTDSSTAISGFEITTGGYLYYGNVGAFHFEGAVDNMRISNDYTRSFVPLRGTDSWPG